MDLPRNFKFDVRIRSRLLAKGSVTEAEVGKYLEALEDRLASSSSIDVAQPALVNPDDRPTPPASAPVPSHMAEARTSSFAPAPHSERSAPRSVAPGPLAVDDGWDEEDDDELDDDEDGDEIVKTASPKPGAPAPAPVPAPAAKATADSESEKSEPLADEDDGDGEDTAAEDSSDAADSDEDAVAPGSGEEE